MSSGDETGLIDTGTRAGAFAAAGITPAPFDDSDSDADDMLEALLRAGEYDEDEVGGAVAGAVAGAVILLVLHAGYFAAPWLVHTGRSGLALVLMAPAALIASGLALFLFGFTSPSVDTRSSDLWGFLPVRPAVFAGTAIVYLGPLVLVASMSEDRA